MENRYLARSEAPISAETWAMLDETMAGAAKGQMAGRRLLHIEGPYGFGLKAVPLEDCEASGNVIQSNILPLNLIQTAFTLGKTGPRIARSRWSPPWPRRCRLCCD